MRRGLLGTDQRALMASADQTTSALTSVTTTAKITKVTGTQALQNQNGTASYVRRCAVVINTARTEAAQAARQVASPASVPQAGGPNRAAGRR